MVGKNKTKSFLIVWLQLFVLMPFLGFFFCSKENSIAGGSSQVGNGIVSAFVLRPDSVLENSDLGLSGVIATLLPADFNPLVDDIAREARIDTTDSSGSIIIDSLYTGEYALNCVDPLTGFQVRVSDILVDSDADTGDTNSYELKPTGTVFIRLTGLEEGKEYRIFIPGSNFYTSVSSDSLVEIPALPADTIEFLIFQMPDGNDSGKIIEYENDLITEVIPYDSTYLTNSLQKVVFLSQTETMPDTVKSGELFIDTIQAAHSANYEIFYRIILAPEKFQIDSVTGICQWPVDSSSYWGQSATVSIEAYNPASESDTLTWDIYVTSPDTAVEPEPELHIDTTDSVSLVDTSDTLDPFDSTVHILDTNAYLSALVVSEGSLFPAFDKDSITYEVSLGKTIDSIVIMLASASTDARIKVNDSLVSAGTDSVGPVGLTYGNNQFVIEIIAQDTNFTTIYNLEVFREPLSANTDISDLRFTVHHEEDNDYTYTFDLLNDSTLEQSLSIPFAYNTISFYGKTVDSLSTISIATSGIDTIQLVQGQQSAQYGLDSITTPMNFSVIVTAEDRSVVQRHIDVEKRSAVAFKPDYIQDSVFDTSLSLTWDSLWGEGANPMVVVHIDPAHNLSGTAYDTVFDTLVPLDTFSFWGTQVFTARLTVFDLIDPAYTDPPPTSGFSVQENFFYTEVIPGEKRSYSTANEILWLSSGNALVVGDWQGTPRAGEEVINFPTSNQGYDLTSMTSTVNGAYDMNTGNLGMFFFGSHIAKFDFGGALLKQISFHADDIYYDGYAPDATKLFAIAQRPAAEADSFHTYLYVVESAFLDDNPLLDSIYLGKTLQYRDMVVAPSNIGGFSLLAANDVSYQVLHFDSNGLARGDIITGLAPGRKTMKPNYGTDSLSQRSFHIAGESNSGAIIQWILNSDYTTRLSQIIHHYQGSYAASFPIRPSMIIYNDCAVSSNFSPAEYLYCGSTVMNNKRYGLIVHSGPSGYVSTVRLFPANSSGEFTSVDKSTEGWILVGIFDGVGRVVRLDHDLQVLN